MIGQEEPEIIKQMRANKMMTFVGIFFLNSVAASMSATGAFEIYYNGMYVYMYICMYMCLSQCLFVMCVSIFFGSLY